jgi:hypothetical protein
LESCRKRLGGCAQAADAMWLDDCRQRSRGRTRSNGRSIAVQRVEMLLNTGVLRYMREVGLLK